jgi:hypothetical protein
VDRTSLRYLSPHPLLLLSSYRLAFSFFRELLSFSFPSILTIPTDPFRPRTHTHSSHLLPLITSLFTVAVFLFAFDSALPILLNRIHLAFSPLFRR